MVMGRREITQQAPLAPARESWTDSVVWGATVALLAVFLVLAGLGYVGYRSLERPEPAVRTAIRPTGTLPEGRSASRAPGAARPAAPSRGRRSRPRRRARQGTRRETIPPTIVRAAL